MNSLQKQKQFGFSLVEIMLVLVIVGGMIYMGTGYMQNKTRMLQIDRASAQMQQILNAGLTYYVNNGSWPANIAALQAAGYLPATGVVSPWGTSYSVGPDSSNAVLTATVSLPAGYGSGNAIAKILAGRLPFGINTNAPSSSGAASVEASVNIPGQNLNNATNVGFAGLYHNGACVPAPTCPVSGGTETNYPQIMVVPVSVSGMSDTGSTASYPLVSLTAKAVGNGVTADPVDLSLGNPADCGNTTIASAGCYQNMAADGTYSNAITTGKYWRVCLYAVTSSGSVTWDITTGQYATVMAVTRCAPVSENVGSAFDVWGK
jgi:prepilin-type N-terminal cleavage/methylation domain-containing protein